MPGRSTLTATVCPSASRADAPARSRRRRPPGRTTANALAQRLAERGRDRGFRFGLRERRHLVLQRFKIARERGPDDVGPRREELAELHVGRPEPRQRGGEPDRWSPRGLGRSNSRASFNPSRAGAGSGAGSTRPSTPSRANTKPARARRNRWHGRSDHKRQPECSATMPPLITRCDTRAKPAARIISANAFGRGKRRIDSTR